MVTKLLNDKTGGGKKAIFIEKRGEFRENFQKKYNDIRSFRAFHEVWI